jgi:antitoxin VapB
MSLNIKNAVAEEKIRELAARRGVSLVAAVLDAVENEIEREKEAEKREGRLQWLDEITRETAAIMNDGRTSKELFDELYDPETGLPR